MREVLFRGKTTKGNWVYGDLLKNEGKYYIVENDGWSMFFPNEGSAEVYIREVIPDTIGQYIGEDDIAGNKIFEGDIVHLTRVYARWSHRCVYFDRGGFSPFSIAGNCRSLDPKDVRVIGNVIDMVDSLKLTRWSRKDGVSPKDLQKILEKRSD